MILDNPAVLAVASGLLGTIVGAIASIVTSRLQAEQELKRLERELTFQRKADAYAGLLRAAADFKTAPETISGVVSILTAAEVVALFGSESVRAVCGPLFQAAVEEMHLVARRTGTSANTRQTDKWIAAYAAVHKAMSEDLRERETSTSTRRNARG